MIQWKMIRHLELTESDARKIAALKDQHWPHGLESQIMWMKSNTTDDDFHLLGLDENERLRAYLNLNDILVSIDETVLRAIGIGSVCVDKSCTHTGLGKQLMDKANKYIQSSQRSGILLCKEGVHPFYEKCDWALLKVNRAYVQNMIFNNLIMTYPADVTEHECVCIQRSF